MDTPAQFDAAALDSDANRRQFAENRQSLLACLAQTQPFAWLEDDGSPERAAYLHLRHALLQADAALCKAWFQWREEGNVAVDFTEEDRIALIFRTQPKPPDAAAASVRDRLVLELQARRDVKVFFSRLGDALGRSEFLAFQNRQATTNSAIGAALGELYDKVDPKTPFELDPAKVLDILGKIVAVVPGPAAKGVAIGLNAAKTLHQVNAFIAWVADLIGSGESLPWGSGANAGTWGNVLTTLGGIDAVQRRMFADAREQLGVLKQRILYRWGRLRYLYETMLEKQQISPELGDYIAHRIDTGWNYVMWRQLIWTAFRIRAEGPVVPGSFIHPDHYSVDFDHFDTEHNGKPGAKDRLGYVFKGEIADSDQGGRSPQKEGVVYAYYWRTRWGGNDTDRYAFFKYRLVSDGDKVAFTQGLFDYLRDNYGIERRHFLLATDFDAVSHTDRSVFGPAGRYVDPLDNLRLDAGHTLSFSAEHKDATYPAGSKQAQAASSSPDRADFTHIDSTERGHPGEVRDAEFKKVHECYKIRWVHGLGRIDAAFRDPAEGSLYFFGEGNYVRWRSGQATLVSEDRIKLSGSRKDEVIDRTYLRAMDPGRSGNWPGVWTAQLQAALALGEGQVLFFRQVLHLDPEDCRRELTVLQFDMARNAVAVAAKPVLEVWPDFPWAREGIDAAVALHGQLYFFRGRQFVVYGGIGGIRERAAERLQGPTDIAQHFDASRNPQWDWSHGIDAAWSDGAAVCFLHQDEYVGFPLPMGAAGAGVLSLTSPQTQNASMRDYRDVMRLPH